VLAEHLGFRHRLLVPRVPQPAGDGRGVCHDRPTEQGRLRLGIGSGCLQREFNGMGRRAARKAEDPVYAWTRARGLGR